MARFPVLMYHNVSSVDSDSIDLTISTHRLDEQLQYLKEHNYTTIFASELVTSASIPIKSIVITFDDVTVNQLVFALPLLKKYNCKATFFIPFNYVGKTDEWNNSSCKIMTVEQLKSIDNELVEFGHHSFFHRKYSELTLQQIEEDLAKSFKFVKHNNLKVYPSLAFPYGNFPKKEERKKKFFELLEKNEIKLAFRIGNRTNKFPIKNQFLIKRIDVKGQDSLLTFKWKLKLGKLRLF
jgi:peptidoglycan/xylan/chitin deacetylase (PgdA/CDA1 family)